MKAKGYYLNLHNKDCFLITNQQRKTDKLALKFLNALKCITNDDGFTPYYEVLYKAKSCMQPAIIEERVIVNGRFAGLKYLVVSGNGFGCSSSTSLNPYEEIIVVKDVD
jgi:hypothetical protein